MCKYYFLFRLLKHFMNFNTNKIYCYCNSCKKISSSRLRYKCKECFSDAVEITRDPNSFADVLEENKISCTCFNQEVHKIEETKSFTKFYQKCNGCNSSDTQILPNVNIQFVFHVLKIS